MNSMRLVHTASTTASFHQPGVMTPLYFERSGIVAWYSITGDWFGVPLSDWIWGEHQIYKGLSFALILEAVSRPGGLADIRRQIIRSIDPARVKPYTLDQLQAKGGAIAHDQL